MSGGSRLGGARFGGSSFGGSRSGGSRFGEVFRFELRYQLSRPSTWIYFLVVNALLLRLTTEAFFDQAREANYFFNAPHVLATASLFGSFVGMVFTAAVAGDAAARDAHTRLAPLMYTSPVGKAAYLGGRFLAALAVVAGLMLAVPLGQWLLLWLTGLEPELIGPFRPAAYALGYAALLLPTLFITAALMFAAAVLTRRAMAAFLVAAGLFVSMLFTNTLLAQVKGMWRLAGLLDPFAFTAMMELTRTRTGLQKAELLVGLEPALLANRGLWMLIACAVLAYAYRRFAFSHEAPPRWRWLPSWRARVVADPLASAEPDLARAAPAPLPQALQRFDAGARVRQVWTITTASFHEIAWSRGAIAAVLVAVIVAVAARYELMEHLGVPLLPVTGHMALALSGAQDFFGFVAPLLCVFYAGELVWRERDAGVHAIADASPLPDWVPLLGKGLGLGLALAAWQGLLMAAGVFTQLSMGYHDLQPLLWLQILFGLGLAGHLLFAVLAIALHVLVNQKYAAHLIGLAAFALTLFGAQFGLEHHLLLYGADPGWDYSDMRGFGLSLGPVLWFKLYWAGWALLFAVGARLLWVRGPETRFGARIAQASERFSGPVLATAALGLSVIVATGGFIFHNTNVRNEFTTAAQREARQVAYERTYAATAQLPQPTLAATTLRVELYPARGRATIHGRHEFINRTSRPIDTLHVETSASVDTGPLRFDRAATLLKDDVEQRHRIVRLATPLQPGEAVAMEFALRFGGRGFGNGGIDQSVAPRASHFEQDWLPVLDYQRDRELDDEVARRRLGLPARPEITPLDDVAARYDLRGYERIRLDTTIGTATGQTAVAPGTLQRSWTKQGRRYFHYTTAAPIANRFGIYSADYAVHEARWRDVAIRIYHHPAHTANVQRMAQAVQASLHRYTHAFGPYPAAELTVVEAPGYDLGARSHPTSIRVFEGYALMDPDADARKIDFTFAVMAHEIAHQWWGSNQLSPAAVAGAPFIAESLAWYSALGVIADAKGEAHLDRFLDVMREGYLTPRARDGVPLLEAADWFTAYRRGPFSMVALRDAVGEARVDLALRRFMQKHGGARPPLPTSLDLYAELKAVTPVAQHELLADLFERNTYWNLRTHTVSAEPVGNAWRVTLEVSADKVSVDRQGKETVRPLDEPIDIGVYGAGSELAQGATLYLRKHRLHSGVQRITVTVPSRPATAGIDPRNVLIDTLRSDNVIAVVAKS